MISSEKIPQRFIMVDDDAISNMLSQELVRRVCGEVEVQLFIEPAKALSFIDENYKTSEKSVSTVLLLDLHTPSMTGWEFLEKFKQLSPVVHKQFTIFILSSTSNERDLETVLSNIFVSALVLKPLNKATLRQLLLARA